MNKQAVKAARKVASANSYEVVTREWIANRAEGWSESNTTKVLARQENDVFPFLGDRPINSITAPELLVVLKAIECRGAVDTAHRALQNCSRIFRYALATHKAERDPAADLRGDALKPVKSKGFATITKPAEVGALLRALDGYEGNIVVA